MVEWESALCAFVVGKCRWTHGSSLESPLSRLNQRGVFTMEQLVSAKPPFHDDFVERRCLGEMLQPL